MEILPKPKRVCNVLNLSDKVAILGLSLAGVGQHYGKNELSICKTGNTA
jgi:hypothetical protein